MKRSWIRLLHRCAFSVLGSLLLILSVALGSCATNRLESRLFHNKPELHTSPSRFVPSTALDVDTEVETAVDLRSKYNGTKIAPFQIEAGISDFWRETVPNMLTYRMRSDLVNIGWRKQKGEKTINIKIIPKILIWYPYIEGFIWLKAYGFVRIGFVVSINEETLLVREYDWNYVTDGTDKDYEGPIADTIENAANIAVGICLRNVLDRFYVDLENVLKGPGTAPGKLIQHRTEPASVQVRSGAT